MRIEALKDFLNTAHSVYHGVAALQTLLEQAGYTRLEETCPWQLCAGGRYYVIRGGSSLFAFRLPEQTPTGFLITASHADRPAFKVKENGELTGKYTRLATETYGGMILSTWLDRPLSIAGRVLVETPEGAQSRLVDIQQDLLMIPNVAIHMNRAVNDGVKWNPAVDTLPLLGGASAEGKLQALLEQQAGGKLLGHDLYLYVRQSAGLWGVEQEYLYGQGLDDLVCAWCCAQGFLQAKTGSAIPVLCVFDSEEVGSCSVQGADSRALESLLGRICAARSLPAEQLLANSFLLSADNGHALHPNHPEYADATNAPLLGRGIVLKFHSSLRYTTDGASAAVVRKVCQRAQVPVQTYYNRADLPGGSTLGSICLSHVSVPAADIGLPQLAMHSCCETVAVQDVAYLEAAMAAYYEADLQFGPNGSFRVG